GILGSTAVAAYAGLIYVGRPKEGETVVVSAAAGATGSMVGQIAKIKGCRAVGIAGSDDKCRHVVENLGFDACINYKNDGFREALRETCPGAISVYNAEKKPPGPSNYLNLITVRGRMEGFNGMDYWGKRPEISAELQRWMAEGTMKNYETIVDGLDEAWRTVNMLFSGENIGKLLVKVAEG
ncbi:MAG: NADP-dependent oxidoreductase, partial [Deltaproteobacteria bacterium]|nr:NADP-dependent oxidoreductase [Deltaproteobacteria bacterium]